VVNESAPTFQSSENASYGLQKKTHTKQLSQLLQNKEYNTYIQETSCRIEANHSKNISNLISSISTTKLQLFSKNQIHSKILKYGKHSAAYTVTFNGHEPIGYSQIFIRPVKLIPASGRGPVHR
jgi:hypothetical protein